MNVTIRLFGAFRKTGRDQVTLEMPEHSTIADLRKLLAEALARLKPEFGGRSLLQTSAICDEHGMLPDAEVVPVSGTLAVVPPVSGGSS